MNILFINSVKGWGGGEVFLMDMLNGLTRRGHSVSLICRQQTPLANQASSEGLVVYPIRIGGDIDPFVIWKTRRIMVNQRIELVCTNTEKDLRFGGIAAKFAGVKSVIALREVDRPVKDTLAYRLTYNWCASMVAVNSHATRKTLSRSAPWLDDGRIRVIYKGIHMSNCAESSACPLHEEFGISPDAPVVCFVGRLDEQKGLGFLLEAWTAIYAEYPDAKLILFGDGNLRESIAQFIAAHGLQKSVFLAGFRRDIPSLLKQCSVLVLPSLWEGFGYAALEGMAAGLPVVATATSSLPEVIENGKSGILVEPRNSRAIAGAITQLLGNLPLARRLGDYGRRLACERFTLDAMLQSFENLFEEQLGYYQETSLQRIDQVHPQKDDHS